MQSLVTTLIEFLEQAMRTRFAQEGSSRIQPVFVGPPLETLSQVFDALTVKNTQEWRIPGIQTPIVVLFVDGNKTARLRVGNTLSQRCNWDYVISNRNSVPAFITLVAPQAWDDRQESITNATETIGNSQASNAKEFFGSAPWPFIKNKIVQKLGVSESVVSWALNFLFRETRSLEANLREEIPWIVADDLLAITQAQDLARCIGLPSLGSHPLDVSHLQDSYNVLSKNFTRQLCSKLGLQEAEKVLRAAAVEVIRQDRSLRPFAQPLRKLFGNLYRNVGVGSRFERCPMWYFRPASPASQWWDELPYEKLQGLLDKVGATSPQPQGKLELQCSNALNRITPLEKEPFLVFGPVELDIQDSQGNVLPPVSVSRKMRQKKDNDEFTTTSGKFFDTQVPNHDQPIFYTANSENYQPVSIEVLSLATLACHGHARVRNALRNPSPSAVKISGGKSIFEQKIVLARGGIHELTVYRSPDDTFVSVIHPDQPPLQSPDNPATFYIHLDDEEELLIAILDANKVKVGEWSLHSLVEEPDEYPTKTRFESLVKAHQEHLSRPRQVSPDLSSHALELESDYLNSPESWQGVTACWTSKGQIFSGINWDTATLGNLVVDASTRIKLGKASPPSSYLQSREIVRQYLRNFQVTIGEMPLAEQGLAKVIERYLYEYTQWLLQEPEAALWTDCIALYAPVMRVEWEREIATSEPTAILLSPLHPLRLAWHSYAQRVLDEALTTKPCTAAGTINPHATPGILALPIYSGDTLLAWRTFFAVGCNQPHWSLLWNRDFLGNVAEKKVSSSTLEWLGFTLNGLTGGFTPSQAKRSLKEVSALLSARATLRVGLVGDSQESAGCIEGLVDWCKTTFSSSEEVSLESFPRSGEIYDLRDKPSSPSVTALAILSEETDERVRWFSRGVSSALENMDIVILDQVGTREIRGVKAVSRSPLAPGALMKIDIRQDIGDAPTIQESKISYQDATYEGIEGAILKATIHIESSARKDNSLSHIQFKPNQQAIGSRLEESRFVAATSSQVDPACFIRGTRDFGGYLWDYELPGSLGFDRQNAGYYLVAKPSNAMRKAIIATIEEVISHQLPEDVIDELLNEVSRRGIPVLKRLASGGNHARGELGVLLGVRLLQDAFRPTKSVERLPIVQGNCVHLLLPVDSYREPFSQFQRDLDKTRSGERPDILVFSIHLPESGSIQVKITPLEIKFRDHIMSKQESKEALQQAANLGSLLEALWVQDAPNTLWRTCTRALLAQCLDQSFRVYADPALHKKDSEEWTQMHQRILHDVIGGSAMITVNRAGRAFVFDKSSGTQVHDYDGDGRPDTVVFAREDAGYLLANIGSLSSQAESALHLLDFSFPNCGEMQKDSNSILQEKDVQESSAFPVSPVIVQGTLFPEQLPETTSSDSIVTQDRPHIGTNGNPQVLMNTSLSPITPQLREKVQAAFDGFIGNNSAVRRLTNDLLRALIEAPPHLPKNYLFTGQPSTGKTEMARRMARALDLPFVQLDGRGLTSRERLFELVNGELRQQNLLASQVGQQASLPVMEYPPIVIFVDEVHLVPRSVQESLLTMLESADRTVTLSSQVAKVNKATFLFATTRASDVDAAFHSRCAEVQLKVYSQEEVAEIVKRRFPLGWERDIYLEIAKLGRNIPRMAIELARELETQITVSEYTNYSPSQHLEEVRTARELDELGLTLSDIEYLKLLKREGRPIGEQAILNMMRTVDKDRILNDIEPYLIQLGFIKLGVRGREITDEGIQYLLGNTNN